MNCKFWKDKSVFLTGHTGFKGSWLSILLNKLGARVTGYALPPPTNPSLFKQAKIDQIVNSIEGDIRDRKFLLQQIKNSEPEIVIHMAAQPLVRESYIYPVETYETNVMGTVHLLDAVRSTNSVRTVVNVTTDKVYENKEWEWGYRECEPFGGYDPYSNSKACSELVTSSYRNSFFNPADYSKHKVAVASARAGNVIGGGDWAIDRIVPDCVCALSKGETITLRNPYSIRPWQHVLEPLSGYLLLAEMLFTRGVEFAEGWNFGPEDRDCVSVELLVKKLCKIWGENSSYTISNNNSPHEANFLKLDCSKARNRMKWTPHWHLDDTLNSIVAWAKGFQKGQDIMSLCIEQINTWLRA
ncbi:MAG: CDP-glucose 4,6-dehydratase [Chitinispirillaceae bacterium]|nr:CDP-glucose 4,6-dehydratase [Chitinispirillaceae bacterium]